MKSYKKSVNEVCDFILDEITEHLNETEYDDSITMSVSRYRRKVKKDAMKIMNRFLKEVKKYTSEEIREYVGQIGDRNQGK